MKHCKIAVMPSVYESYGLAAQEMLSYGRPVVCTDVNGLPDTVGNGGLIVKSKDPKALSDAMNRLLGDEELRRELGHNARLVAESRNVGATVDAVEQVYTKVLSGE
jgi:glycosyltransferase involved in cell wall biosynthesis